jgi:uncharacterized protein (TIGR02246 family)
VTLRLDDDLTVHRSGMRSLARTAVAAVSVLLLANAASAQGRTVPGAQTADSREELSAYNKDVLRHADEIIAQWRDAWGNRDAGVLATLYTRDAVLIPLTGQPLKGQAAIRRGLPSVLSKAGPITTTRLDFGTSGEVAYDVEQFTYGVEENGVAGPVHTGIAVIIFKRHWDGHWAIQSQTLALLPNATD